MNRDKKLSQNWKVLYKNKISIYELILLLRYNCNKKIVMKKIFILGFVLLYINPISAQLMRNEWIDYSKTYYKLKLGTAFGTDAGGAPIRSGLCRISASVLTTAGMSTVQAEQIQLWRNGEQVPVYTSIATGAMAATDFIEFWGEINDGKLDADLYLNSEYQLSDYWSLQTDTASYFVTTNSNTSLNKRLVTTTNNVAGNTLTATNYFMYTVGRTWRQEINGGFSTFLGERLYSSSYDRGEGFVSRRIRPNGNSCGGQAQLPQNFNDLQPYLSGPDMILKVNAVGNAANSRSVKILLNGDSITIFQMDYLYDNKLIESGIPVSKINSGNAQIITINQSNVECDEIRLSLVELTYPRKFNFSNVSNFEFNLPSNPSGHFLEISNFNYGSAAPILYDLTNGKRYVGDILIADTIRFAIPSLLTNSRFVLVKQDAFVSLNTSKKRNFVDYKQKSFQGDYLIISNPLIYGSGATNFVQQYSDYRESIAGGEFNPKIIDINEIEDQFAYGVKKHPLSIKNFLKFCRANFSEKPKYAFIIGKGVTYNEYRNNESNVLADQLNLVPTWGNPASDNILGSDDLTAKMETPVGRLSAVTAQEVGDYLQKVKEFELNQKDTTATIDKKLWMKNVLQIAGVNDAVLGTQLDGFMQGYKNIITDTAFGAKVTNFSKTADPAGYTDAILNFKNLYEGGTSLITYFGHSSATSLDFNLDNPENYNNQNKYPFFIANGCSAGNHFSFETNRFSNKTTISEKFVLANQRGAIGYLASTHFGVVNYLDRYTQEFYNAMSKSQYGRGLGDIIKEGINQSLNFYGANDYYSRVHAETYALDGDPAIKINVSEKADFVINDNQITVSSSYVSLSDESYDVKIKVHNIGKAINDSVAIKVIRQFPNGTSSTIFNSKLPAIKYADSMVLTLPIITNRDEGTTKLTVIIDPDNLMQEIKKTNNSASKDIIISEDEIRPIFPYNFSIVNQAGFKLSASTVNPFSAVKTFVVEVDTTELFNSPIKSQQIIASKGGVVEFNPSITYQNGTTYYWRTGISGLGQKWNVSSFTYNTNSYTGFEQRHLYQFFKNQMPSISLDSISRKFSYQKKTNNLFIQHSIYPTSGLEDIHFSVSVNGTAMIRSACIGSSVIFNVFDTLTFKPWKNQTGQDFGSGGPYPNCVSNGREFNFEFSYTSATERNKAKSFMDSIPSGMFVVARLIYDGVQTFANEWANDSTIYGSGNTLYTRFKQQGFNAIDSFNKPRTFALIFKKNSSSSFTPIYNFSDGVYDRISLSQNVITSDTMGYINTPKMGPSKYWKNVKWSGTSLEAGNDDVKLKVIGVDNSNSETLLYTLNTTQQNFDISSVNATQYPFIKLQVVNQDSITATPYQINNLKIEFDPSAEGAVAPNILYSFTDSVGFAGTSDSLKLKFAFKNVSKINFDSLKVKMQLIDSVGNITLVTLPKTRPVAAGDTVHILIQEKINSLSGKYNVYVIVNPDNDQKEQFSFNNFLYQYVNLRSNQLLPVTLVDFYARPINNLVELNWTVMNEENFLKYEIQHSTDSRNFTTFTSIAPKNNVSVETKYQAYHNNPITGKNYYRLKMVDKDGSVKYSAIRLINFGKGIQISVYPNPTTDFVNISISKADNKTSTLRLVNMFGQIVQQKMITNNGQLDVRNVSSGSYLLIIDSDGKSETYKIQKQ